MVMVRPALLLALALTLAPACGHKGPPLPPRRRTPPTLSGFRLAQRGATLEISCTAPSASVEGVPFKHVDIELFWGEGWIDLEAKGERRTVRAEPGARVVETVPLPPPGTLVRASGRATTGRDEGQRSLILTLQTHAPLASPVELSARLRPRGVTLSWHGERPEKIPPPDLGTADDFTRPFAGRPFPGIGTPLRERDEPPTPDAVSEKAGQRPVRPGAGAGRRVTEGTTSDRPASAADEPSVAAAVGEDEDVTPAVPLPRSHGFRVYRRLPPGSYKLPLVSEPQERRLFTDANAPLGVTVCYVIRAVGSVEPLIESAPSNEVCLDVRDINPPAPPSGLAVVPRDGGLEVVWSPSSESDLGGYRIYRAVGEEEPERVGEVPAGTTVWLDTAPQPGVLYRYAVTAFDRAGNEGPPSGAAQGRGP